MPKISIIIPIYNAENYLKRCLDSVINQTLRDIEIICVDDGSTDASLDILKEYAKADSRIKIIHKKNGGLVSARKAGVAVASGAYAGYVDSDDWIDQDMYEQLYNIIRQKQAELVTCGYYLEGNYTTKHLDTIEEGFYHADKMAYLRENTIYRMDCRETGIRGGLWCKLFLTGLLKKVQEQIPDHISIAEDKVCLLTYILECSSVYVLKRPLYHWVIHQSSMSHESKKQDNDYLVKVNNVYNYLVTLYQHTKFTENMRHQAEIYITELIFLGINKRMGFKNRNMIWIDPYWLDKIPLYSRIVLYGAGELGEKYEKQLCRRADIELVAIVDDEYRKKVSTDCGVMLSCNLKDLQYDYVVITIKNKDKALCVKEKLCEQGVANAKIIWCEQPEAYWKFIEAERNVNE